MCCCLLRERERHSCAVVQPPTCVGSLRHSLSYGIVVISRMHAVALHSLLHAGGCAGVVQAAASWSRALVTEDCRSMRIAWGTEHCRSTAAACALLGLAEGLVLTERCVSVRVPE